MSFLTGHPQFLLVIIALEIEIFIRMATPKYLTDQTITS